MNQTRVSDNTSNTVLLASSVLIMATAEKLADRKLCLLTRNTVCYLTRNSILHTIHTISTVHNNNFRDFQLGSPEGVLLVSKAVMNQLQYHRALNNQKQTHPQ